MSRKEGMAWYSMRPMPFLRMAFSPSVIGSFAPPSGPPGLVRDLSTPRELATAGFFAHPPRDPRDGSEISLHLESWPQPASLLLRRDPRDWSEIFLHLESWSLPALYSPATRQKYKIFQIYEIFYFIQLHPHS